jgi:hypothetical protein
MTIFIWTFRIVHVDCSVTRISPIWLSPIGESPLYFHQYTLRTFVNWRESTVFSPIYPHDFRQLANVHCAFTSVTCRLERVTGVSARTFGLDQNVTGLSSRVQIISLIIIKQIKSIWAQSEIPLTFRLGPKIRVANSLCRNSGLPNMKVSIDHIDNWKQQDIFWHP